MSLLPGTTDYDHIASSSMELSIPLREFLLPNLGRPQRGGNVIAARIFRKHISCDRVGAGA